MFLVEAYHDLEWSMGFQIHECKDVCFVQVALQGSFVANKSLVDIVAEDGLGGSVDSVVQVPGDGMEDTDLPVEEDPVEDSVAVKLVLMVDIHLYYLQAVENSEDGYDRYGYTVECD